MAKLFGCVCFREKEEEISVLDYRHCSLKEVPKDIFNYERTLEELFVDANQIKELPRELFYCHGLKKLTLSDNEITSIPPAIASLNNLEELDISKNGIIDLPDNVKTCKHLSIVEASVNPLGKLPDGFTQLLNLTQLFLNDTFLDYLPGNFGRLSKLKILEVRENHLKTLPKSMARLTELERLDIGQNEFIELPEVIGSLGNLLELWCDSNQITHIPAAIGSCKNLMYLDASKNRIEWVAPEMEGCISLSDFHLSVNLLQELPESIGRLSNLTTLKVDDNQLTSLPFSVGGLVSLSELNVSANDIEELPPSIGLLRHLRTLYADENFLMELPPELGSCSGLTVLSVRSNKLTYIPDEIGRIPRLRVLNLADNEIRAIPYSFMKLKELQALWLSENQSKPLIRLQSDIDVDTGKRMLTCYLLPQQPTNPEDIYSDDNSFHPSMWEEERRNKRLIQFDFGDQPDPDLFVEPRVSRKTKLERVPTPYPKEMKDKVRHARNLAMRQMLNGDAPRPPDAAEETEVKKPLGDSDLPVVSAPQGAMAKPQGSVHDIHEMAVEVEGIESEPRATSPKPNRGTSPLLQERHYLYKFDKEKLQRDKARMQQRHTSPERTEEGKPKEKSRKTSKDSSPVREVQLSKSESSKKGKDKKKKQDDDGGFLDASSSRRYSNPPRSVDGSTSTRSTRSDGGGGAAQNGQVPMKSDAPISAVKYQKYRQQVKNVMLNRLEFSSDTGYMYSKQRNKYNSPSRLHRIKDYDSDVGYRSDQDLVRGRWHGKPLNKGKEGYASDWEVAARAKFEAYAREGYGTDLERSRPRKPDSVTPGTIKSYPAISLPENMHNAAMSGSNLSLQQESVSRNYSNIPTRTLIRNDEMYEPKGTPQMSRTGIGARSPLLNQSGTPNMRRIGMNTPVGQNNTQPVHDANQSARDGNQSMRDQRGRQDWKSELYTVLEKKKQEHAANLSKHDLPHPQNGPQPDANVSRSFSINTLNTSDDDVFTPPPYQPAPPYCPPKREPQSPDVQRRTNYELQRIEERDRLRVEDTRERMERLRLEEKQRQENLERSRELENGRDRDNFGPPRGARDEIPRAKINPDIDRVGNMNESKDINRSLNSSQYRPQDDRERDRPRMHTFEGAPRTDSPSLQRPGYNYNNADLNRTRQMHNRPNGMNSPSLGHKPPDGVTHMSAESPHIQRQSGDTQRIYMNRDSNIRTAYNNQRGNSALYENSRNLYRETVSANDSLNPTPQIPEHSVHNHYVNEPPPPHAHHQISNYDDVAKFKAEKEQLQDPASQVSSSTDSGYGHGHHIYEKVTDLRLAGFPSMPPPNRNPPSPPKKMRPSPVSFHHMRDGNGYHSRESSYQGGDIGRGSPFITGTNEMGSGNLDRDSAFQSRESSFQSNDTFPSQSASQPSPKDRYYSGSQNHSYIQQPAMYFGDYGVIQLPVTVNKNPGLGFSIAGGRGSQGNPYKPTDPGIFVTKVQPEGPASLVLRPGDKIIEVNGLNFVDIEHGLAVSALKNSGQMVSLVVERERETASKV